MTDIENQPLTPERITLTFYDRKAQKIGVAWHTKDAGNPEIRYVRMPEGCTDPEAADFSAAKRIPCKTSEGLEGVKNSGVMEDLLPDTDYCYIVGDAARQRWSRRSVVRRRTPKENAFTVLVVADTQDQKNKGSMWKRALDDAFQRYPDASFLIHAGDMVQGGGDPGEWKDMLGAAAEYTGTYPLLQAAGNHEYHRCYLSGHLYVTSSHYHMELPPQDTANGMYYAREFGDALFLVLNSGDDVETGCGLTDTQLAWIEEELSSTDKTWRIAVIHNPLYSPGKYGSNPNYNGLALVLRKQLNGMFEKYRVKLCLCGHDHVWSKTYPINGRGEVLAPGAAGTVHVMPGCAGIQCRDSIVDLSPEDYAAIPAVCEEYLPTESGQASYAAVRVTPERLEVFYHIVDCENPKNGSVCRSHFTLNP